MKFDSKTDEQIAQEEADAKASGTLVAGTYDFEIIKADEKISEKGNAMFELNLSVYGTDGEPRSVRDWILPKMPKKFKHCLDACGLTDKYEKGEVTAEDFLSKTGKLEIKQKEYINKDGLKMMTNYVEDYVKRVVGQEIRTAIAPTKLDDEIPF